MAKSPIPKSICLILALSLLLIPPAQAQTALDRRFGAVEAFRDPVAAAEAGVGWDRILFYWSELQPKGPDDWNGYHVPNDWLTLAAGAGREVVGLLKSTPAWATDGLALCGLPRGLYLPVDDPGNLWAAFVRRVAGMYAGRVDHWIIWNEPDIQPDTFGSEWCGSMEDYYQLLKVTYLAAHEANPDVTIHLAGATTWHDPAYLQNFLTAATQDPEGAEHGYFFDVVSLHIYFRPETIPEIFGATRATLAAYGLQKPIWLNETNGPSNADPPYFDLPGANFDITLEEQASYLLQSFALALSSGAARIAVYKWMDTPPQPGVEQFGIIRLDYSRRPAFDAYKLITTHYAGTVSAREDRQSLYTVVTLDRGDLTTRVLWARTEADVTVSVPALTSQARLIDQTGEEQIIKPVSGQYALELPRARCADTRGCIIGGPTYLLVEEASSDLLPEETATPTVTPEETAEPTPTEIITTTVPTETPTPLPTDTPTPLPTPIAQPPVSTMPDPPAWPMLAGLAAVMLFAVIVGTLFKHQG
jgi:hypothetical protein